MGPQHYFRPRNERAAKKVLFVLTVVAAALSVLFAYVFPTAATRDNAGVTALGSGVMVALVCWLIASPRPSVWAWALYPLAAVAAVGAVDIASGDAGITAQVFLFFPVLYAGAQLRRPAAMAVCAAAIAAEAIVTATRLPISSAAVDTSFVAATLLTSALVLVGLAERNDALIAELERQAVVDPLTGLFTRRVLDQAAASALTSAGTGEGTALLLIDVDKFKHVNDVHGHPTGDVVLQRIAAILQQITRRTDVISRLGGDEIAVLVHCCSLELARAKAQSIVAAVREEVFDIGASSQATDPDAATELRVTVSIGIAHLPTHAHDLLSLYAAADASLYDAKRGGRDQVGAPAPEGAPAGRPLQGVR